MSTSLITLSWGSPLISVWELRPYTNVSRIPVYVVVEKVATGEAAARLVAAMKFVVALECFDFR